MESQEHPSKGRFAVCQDLGTIDMHSYSLLRWYAFDSDASATISNKTFQYREMSLQDNVSIHIVIIQDSPTLECAWPHF
jgi:hypothetical protein